MPFKYVSVNGDVKTLTEAYERNNKLIFNHAVDQAPAGSRAVFRVEVNVEDNSEAYPQLTTDESYTLNIPAAGSGSETGVPAITITAKTVYGAMYGLQSLSQLVVYDFDADAYVIPATPMKIEDAPRFPHRGECAWPHSCTVKYHTLVLNEKAQALPRLHMQKVPCAKYIRHRDCNSPTVSLYPDLILPLSSLLYCALLCSTVLYSAGMLLDTSRHFQPVPFLQQTVDALSYAKYNVLHWHVVDTQSFPFESKTYDK